MTFFFPWVVVVLVFGLNRQFPSSFETLFLINIWLFSLPHTFSTITRSDRRSVKSFSFAIGLLLFFLLAVLTVSHLAGMVLVYSLYFYWQQFHYAKQNFGMAGWNSSKKSDLLDQCFFVGTAAICLAGLFSEGSQGFFGYVLMNPFLTSVPKSYLVLALMLVTAAYLCLRPRQFKPALGHVGIFGFCYLYCEHFALGWLLLNIFHNIQYLVFMKNFELRPSFIVLPLVLTGVLYLLQFHLISGLILFSLPASLGIMLSLNFTHYTLDGLIWRNHH